MSWQMFKKVFRANRERPRELYNVFQAYIPFAPFHPTDVIAMKFRPFRQLFLRIAALFPESAYSDSKQRFGRGLGHLFMV